MGYIWLVQFRYIIVYVINLYTICIVYKAWPDLLHHFSGQPCSTSSLVGTTVCVILYASLFEAFNRGFIWPKQLMQMYNRNFSITSNYRKTDKNRVWLWIFEWAIVKRF